MFLSLFRQWKLKRKLAAYVATLSPEKQARAAEFRKRLMSATPEQSVVILRSEIATISEKQMRVVEKISAIKL